MSGDDKSAAEQGQHEPDKGKKRKRPQTLLDVEGEETPEEAAPREQLTGMMSVAMGSSPPAIPPFIKSLVFPGSPYRYAFSICCDLDDNLGSLQEVTGGLRKQVNYLATSQGKTGWSDGAQRENLFSFDCVDHSARVLWNGVPMNVLGTIASGTDWVVVDGLGVASFNARVTLKLAMDPAAGFKPKGQYVLVNATIKGTVDLMFREVEQKYVMKSGGVVVDDFKLKNRVFNINHYMNGNLGGGVVTVPVSMSVRFEGPSGPLAADGADTDWIPDSQKNRQNSYIAHYGALSRLQYFGLGFVDVDRTRRGWPASKIELHLMGLHLGQIASQAELPANEGE